MKKSELKPMPKNATKTETHQEELNMEDEAMKSSPGGKNRRKHDRKLVLVTNETHRLLKRLKAFSTKSILSIVGELVEKHVVDSEFYYSCCPKVIGKLISSDGKTWGFLYDDRAGDSLGGLIVQDVNSMGQGTEISSQEMRTIVRTGKNNGGFNNHQWERFVKCEPGDEFDDTSRDFPNPLAEDENQRVVLDYGNSSSLQEDLVNLETMGWQPKQINCPQGVCIDLYDLDCGKWLFKASSQTNEILGYCLGVDPADFKDELVNAAVKALEESPGSMNEDNSDEKNS